MSNEKEDSSTYKKRKIYVYMETHKRLEHHLNHDIRLLEQKVKNYTFFTILALISGMVSLFLWII